MAYLWGVDWDKGMEQSSILHSWMCIDILHMLSIICFQNKIVLIYPSSFFCIEPHITRTHAHKYIYIYTLLQYKRSMALEPDFTWHVYVILHCITPCGRHIGQHWEINLSSWTGWRKSHDEWEWPSLREVVTEYSQSKHMQRFGQI